MKTNPFPWFPWWPKSDAARYPLIVLGLVLAAALIYFAF
jgi:hypothetical protein